MKPRSKRYRQCLEKVPPKPVPLADAVKIVKEFPATKFDSSIQLVMHLGIDPKQADQALRGALSLPHGIGATKKVIAFCEGSDAEAAKAAGAIEAGGEELVKKVADGWLDFDVAVAHPGMMKIVSRLGRVLGPQGKMPSPKSGTVTPQIVNAVKEYGAGKVEYRNDDGGNVHAVVGKASFPADQLTENVAAFIRHIRNLRPATTKGTYIKKIALATTMSPAVLVEIQ